MRPLTRLLLCGLLVSRVTADDQRIAGEDLFRKQIEPVLRQHCYQCHSGKAKPLKAGLRLDTPKGMRVGGDAGPVIVAGRPDQSLLLQALRHDGLKMPPNKKLDRSVIAAFTNWIRLGARDPRQDSSGARAKSSSDHWSFQIPRHVSPPVVRRTDWPRNGIDAFVLSRLEREQVRPSPEADRATLLRRVYLDLIGLPPSPAVVAAFRSDNSPNAYERVVDRLLSSPGYGERWGRHWLDMARYADSNGYESDRPRPHAWRWRDWVIRAMNSDLAFDQFTVEQIAGDLLPKASRRQRVATGFHRNTLVNTEGGVDREEDRVKRTVDRTNTIGKVWLGLTLGCCQCHSHKYDTLSHREYFQFYAFFNSLTEPDIPAATVGDLIQYRKARTQFEEQHQTYLTAIRDYRSEAFQGWETDLSVDGPRWEALKPHTLNSAVGSQLKLERDLSIFVTGRNDQADIYTVRARTRMQRVTAIRLQVLADDRLPSKGPGRAGNGNFVLSGLRVFARPRSSAEKSTPQPSGQSSKRGPRIRLKAARADFSQSNRNVKSVLGDDPQDGWAIHPHVGRDHVAVFDLERPVAGPDGVELWIEMEHHTHEDHNIGRFRISVTDVLPPVPLVLPDDTILQILRKPLPERTGQDRLQLIRFFGYQEPGLQRLLDAEQAHLKQKPDDPAQTVKAQAVAEASQPRETRVHLRGDFLSPGAVVQPGTPDILPALRPRNPHPDRLDLARWLVDPANPLTARVTVNRVWQRYFGIGLVKSDDDFGVQGDRPSHPELLDWLALRFQTQGWSLKSLHRLIVTSATYRQSSHARPELATRDPENRWLSHQNRIRVEAEIVRDLALSVGGVLSQRIGGPSVRPPQPTDLTKLGFQTSISWPVSHGADRYRRGLYTFFQRTVPYPMLMAFDAPDSNAACTRRERSNTPLQALTVWNDPVFLTCARGLGSRVVTDVNADGIFQDVVKQRLQHAFELCLARRPTQVELGILVDLFQSQRRTYAHNKSSARALLGKSAPAHVAIEDLAAYISVSRALMNLDEFITRE